MRQERIALFGVVETHLRGEEVPPDDQDFVWEGCNRTTEDRRGGGIGCLSIKTQQWTRRTPECKEHMWMLGKLMGRPVAIAVVYFWSGSQEEMNQKIYECLMQDIQELQGQHEVIVLGDFNGHLEELDGKMDANSRRLMNLARRNNLVVSNLEEKCEGTVTWTARDQCSSIDYGLLSPGIYDRLTSMKIDEDGLGNLGSDHNRLRLIFETHVDRTEKGKQEHRTGHPTEREIEKIATALEGLNLPLKGYEDMENAMKKALKEQIRSRPRRKRRPKAWWNHEVDTAVKRRREASRYHRGIVKRGRREEVNRAWDLFRSCKQKAAACIQASIQRCDRRFMEELRRAGKSAPQRFWRRLRWEARSTSHTQILKQPETGAERLGIQCIPLIEEWYGNMIGAEEPMSVEGDQEIPDVDDKDQGPPAELRVRPTDGELSRAARRIDAKTAMGRDEIPMSLIQGLGPRMRALVAENLTEILADAQIPETWKETRMKLLYKGKGEKADLGNYRPISITSVLYRMCTQIIRTRLQKWAEETEVLGELQNGFRTGRCIEDNLFVVTQCIEVAVQEGRPLYAAFLDISKAYDTVDRNILWSRLRGLGINEADVNLLQALSSALKPTSDDITGVLNHLDQMVNFLVEEARDGPNPPQGGMCPSSAGPILDYMLMEGVLDRLFQWSLYTGEFLNNLKLEQLRIYE
ncbi:hypothetical protein ISCGN_028163, partial [Ixodes scapularis]